MNEDLVHVGFMPRHDARKTYGHKTVYRTEGVARRYHSDIVEVFLKKESL